MDKNDTKESESNNKSTFTRTIIDTKELDKVLKKGSNHGVCGGHNLGNTCFMNSSIACLSNCTELTTYFLTGKYKSDINKNNKDGLGGKLAIAWNNLLEEYWNSGTRAGNPSEVKSTVARKVRKFGGFSQQDSNEFMTEFLSILNEDLNRTDKKEYKELKEKDDDETELDCAKRFWNLHVKLNDSIVTDLFSGLFRSEVQCTNSKCRYKNITFDPFDTLTLPIPSSNELFTNVEKIFYVPKYSIGQNCRIKMNIKKNNSSLKNIMENTKNINEFKYNIKKLKYIKVLDEKLIGFMDENENYNPKDYIFVFDDMTKEGEKNNIIPLYFYKDENISAFPRLLFFEENINFGELKKKIYYYARNCFSNPFKEDINKVDEEIKKYKEQTGKYDEQKLWDLFNKEYDEIFKNEDKKEKLAQFFEDFPYKIFIKKKFESKENICIFDGKNNLENLKEFEISKDEDSIMNLLDKINNNEYCINLFFNTKSSFIISNLNFSKCENYEAKKMENKMDLDELLNYFGSIEYLEKGNEWRCGKCKEKVEAKKKLSIYYVPRLLIICLSRFKKEGRGYSYGKNGAFIDFPLENLDMGKYICGPDKDHSKYDLFAVSQHFGGTGGGHYTAVCKNIDGRWYDYNDSSCSSTSSSHIVSSSAYVLFYRRKTW